MYLISWRLLLRKNPIFSAMGNIKSRLAALGHIEGWSHGREYGKRGKMYFANVL